MLFVIILAGIITLACMFLGLILSSCKKAPSYTQESKEIILLRIDGMQNADSIPLFSSEIINVK